MPREGHNPTHFHWFFCTKQTFLLIALALLVYQSRIIGQYYRNRKSDGSYAKNYQLILSAKKKYISNQISFD